MPRKSLNKNRRNRRRGNRNNQNRKNRSSRGNGRFEQNLALSFQRTLMADTTLIFLRWSFIDGAPYTGAGELIFSGNSIVDPGIGVSAGMNPAGYDVWSQLYGKFRVLASTISMSFMAANTETVSTNAYVTIFPTNIATGVDNTISALDQPYVRKAFFNSSSGNSKARIRNHVSTAKVFGQKILEDPTFAASFGSQPTNEWVWAMNIYDPSGTASNTYEYEVQIVYKVLLFDRLPLVQTSTSLVPVSANISRRFTRTARNNFDYVSCYSTKMKDSSVGVLIDNDEKS